VSDPKATAPRATTPQPQSSESRAGEPSDARPAVTGPSLAKARPEAPEAHRETEAKTATSSEPRLELKTATFEGPLDLLLHLIQEHQLDILDIPVSFVTQKYLEYLQLMRSLSIDVASEYLVMAATLTHIKSKMLLPTMPSGQDDDATGEPEEDPRAELVRRLLEYQKYKQAAADLGDRGTLGRDVFTRGTNEPAPEGPAPFAALGVFSLLDAFEKVLKRSNIKIEHEVIFDRISITDRIVQLTDKLTERRALRFEELFQLDDAEDADGRVTISRFDVVITFLAVLEMCRLRLIRVYQSDPLAPIHLELAAGAAPNAETEAAVIAADAAPQASQDEEAWSGDKPTPVPEATGDEAGNDQTGSGGTEPEQGEGRTTE
jgi:segregation and condensation protein A